MNTSVKKPIRCAIYTRKSTSEGLDQDFTSLDAQREAAQHYIRSQQAEGWTALPESYDDGGFTGANTERPALQKLLADIRDGRIDCVMVYKVDRLSRSLLDFTYLLELFDQHQVTFVSVTQQFSTNTSMGRLTLNILLSFAQFEREMISERTKDKMAAARKKGKWVGGRPVLGYDPNRNTRQLVVNEQEAVLVREIFELYLTERSLLKVTRRLNAQDRQIKAYITKSGKQLGGGRFKTTDVQYLLKNYLYIGQVRYQGQSYPGEHPAIISESLFERVQALLAENRIARSTITNTKCLGLLSKRIYCRACQSIMVHTYSSKGTRRWRYYVCSSAQKRGYDTCPTRSVNAQAMEEVVVTSLRQLARNPAQQLEALAELNQGLASERKALLAQQHELEAVIPKLTSRLEALKSQQADPATRAEIKRLATELQDKEPLLSHLRTRLIQIDEQQLAQKELEQALDITSTAWETLFPQAKRQVLELLLDRVDYDARDQKLGVMLSTRGVQVLQERLEASNGREHGAR